MDKNIYHVPYVYGKMDGRGTVSVRVPGSKSITNRALLLAMLADGPCTLTGALFSDDSRYLQQCIADLGFEIEADEKRAEVRVEGLGGRLPVREAFLYVGSAGTAARFLTALLGLKKGAWHLDSSEQMKRRPMLPLIQSLQELGTRVEYQGPWYGLHRYDASDDGAVRGKSGEKRRGLFPYGSRAELSASGVCNRA